MSNVYQQFRALLPDPPLQAGVVTEVAVGVVTILLPGGGRLRARGSAEVGQTVFVRDNVVEAVAPTLPLELIEV